MTTPRIPTPVYADARKTDKGSGMFGMMGRTRKLHKGDGGFTLIELLVVIIIIAVLAAIAIPTFLGQRQKALDAAAKSLVRNARTAIEAFYVDTRDFSTATAATLKAIEPSIKFTKLNNCATKATADASSKSVNFGSLGPDSFQVGSKSKSGAIFGITVNKATGATTFSPTPW